MPGSAPGNTARLSCSFGCPDGRVRAPGLLGVVALAASLAACSSSKTTPGGLGAPPAGGGHGGSAGTTATTSGSNADDCITEFTLSFCAKVSITGAVTVNGTGNGEPIFGPDDSSLKCSDLANYHPTGTWTCMNGSK